MNREKEKDWSAWLVLVPLIIFIGILTVITKILSLGEVPYLDLNDQVTASIQWQDGTTTDYETMRFPGLDAGDQIRFAIDIPDLTDSQLNALCFYQYHSEVEIYLGDKLLHDYGKDLTQKNEMYGDEYIVFVLPDEAYGKTVHVQVTQMEGKNSDHFTRFYLMRDMDSRLYPLIGNVIHFLLFTIILFVSIAAATFYVSLKLFRRSKISTYLLYLALFSFFVSIWELGSRRIFYVFIFKGDVSALAEFYALFIARYHFIFSSVILWTHPSRKRYIHHLRLYLF